MFAGTRLLLVIDENLDRGRDFNLCTMRASSPVFLLCSVVSFAACCAQLALAYGDGLSGSELGGYHFLWNVGGAGDVNLTSFPGITTGCVALMSQWFGAYPEIREDPDDPQKMEWCNGGIPQLANMSVHTDYIKRDLDMKVDKTFDGFIVVDYEAWRAVWNHTKEIYQNASIQLARKNNPHSPEQKIKEIAVRSYNEAALNFMTTTLKVLLPRYAYRLPLFSTFCCSTDYSISSTKVPCWLLWVPLSLVLGRVLH
eukprot:gb/GECG01011004.1/.p1 GENE.gb/GECG01011004.1/~~gb/GECG01011004.1/.p1  ORF type:complete len:255 (+),score=15.03 gb/GECG01011004.1/:1-765(+)